MLDRLRVLAVKHEIRAEALDVPLVNVGDVLGAAALSLKFRRDLQGELFLCLADAALGGPGVAVKLLGQPFLALFVGRFVPGRLVQCEGGEDRQPQVLVQ